MLGHGSIHDSQPRGSDSLTGVDGARLRVNVPSSSSSSHIHPEVVICQSDSTGSNMALRYNIHFLFWFLLYDEFRGIIRYNVC